jgi:hypothetical protein
MLQVGEDMNMRKMGQPQWSQMAGSVPCGEVIALADAGEESSIVVDKS